VTERRLGVGPAKPLLILVGEAFGADEEREGVPFVGAAGQVLEYILDNIGISRNDLYITNLINERPSPEKPEKQKNDISPYFAHGELTEKGKEAQAGLLQELSAFAANIPIVALGKIATYALTGKLLEITKWRGSPLIFDYYCPRTLVPTLHPSYIQRGNWPDAHLLACDLQKALGYRKNPPVTYRFETVKELDKVLGLLAAARTEPEVAFDIEAPKSQLTCFSLCWNAQEAYCVPVNGRWQAHDRGLIIGALKELLEAPTGPRMILQNGNYDTTFLERHEFIRTNLDRLEDTMYLHHVIYPDIQKRLATLTSIYTDLQFYKDDYDESLATANPELMFEYNAKDALSTYITWRALEKHPQREQFQKTYRELTMGNLPAAQAMQRTGFRVDREALAGLRERTEAEIVPIQAELDTVTASWREQQLLQVQRELDVAEVFLEAEDQRIKWLRQQGEKVRTTEKRQECASRVNLLKKERERYGKGMSAKGDLLKEYFQDKYKEHGGKTANGNSGSYDKAYLQGLAKPTAKRAGLREARLILDIRQRQTQLDLFLKRKLDSNGRHLFSVNVRGTKYGRMSSSKLLFQYGGNVMNTPGGGSAEDNMPQGFRSVFLADRPSLEAVPFFVNLDQSRAEYVHVAHLSGDKVMLEAMEAGHDVHAVTAWTISGIGLDTIAAEHQAVGDSTSEEEVAKARKNLPEWQKLPTAQRLAAEALAPNSSLRQFGKKRNHAWNYREGADGYALRTGVAIKEARRQDALQRSAFQGVVEWWEKIKWTVQKDHQLVNCFGRVIPFMGKWTDEQWRSACAALPQSGVADSTNLAMRTIAAGDQDVTSVRNNVYDSLLLQLKIIRARALEYEATRISTLIGVYKTLLSPEISYGNGLFRVGVDCKIGTCWGKLQKLTPENLLSHLQRIMGETH